MVRRKSIGIDHTSSEKVRVMAFGPSGASCKHSCVLRRLVSRSNTSVHSLIGNIAKVDTEEEQRRHGFSLLQVLLKRFRLVRN